MTRVARMGPVLAALLASTACGAPSGPEIDASVVTDAWGAPDAWAPPDAGLDARGGGISCGYDGRNGGVCRDNDCLGDLACVEEPLSDGAPVTARNRFGIPQAVPVDPSDPRAFVLASTPVPDHDVAVPFASGTLCTEACDVEASPDSCGSCAKCSQAIGFDALGIGVMPFLDDEGLRAFEERSGVCRGHCTFDRASRGLGCAEGYTCDALTNLCLEVCRNDAQCRARSVVTDDGTAASWIDSASARTCNPVTGRCQWTAPTPEPHVGDACARDEDCVVDLGVCLAGGTCAEAQCNRLDLAPDTTPDGVCDGGRGICLGFGGNMGALCVQGCTTAADCNPGNDCTPLLDHTGTPVVLGPFSGYCHPMPAP